MFRGTSKFLATTCLLLCAACDPFPADPQDSLQRARGQQLHVGLTESRPWVVRSGQAASGVEVDLIRGFAHSLGAEPVWHWGSVEEHMASLESFQLQLVAAGLTRDTPWIKHAALSRAYLEEHENVGFRGPVPASLEDLSVAVPPRHALIDQLRERGAEIVQTQALWDHASVLAPEWELEQKGYGFSDQHRLRKHRRVLALPAGENGLLMALDNYLSNQQVTVQP